MKRPLWLSHCQSHCHSGSSINACGMKEQVVFYYPLSVASVLAQTLAWAPGIHTTHWAKSIGIEEDADPDQQRVCLLILTLGHWGRRKEGIPVSGNSRSKDPEAQAGERDWGQVPTSCGGPPLLEGLPSPWELPVAATRGQPGCTKGGSPGTVHQGRAAWAHTCLFRP